MVDEQNTSDIGGVERTVRQVMEPVHQITGRNSWSEPATRYAMIDPILWSLGWRTWLPSECGPDFTLGNRGRVNYALFDDHGDIAIFVNCHPSYTRRRYGRIRLRECVRGARYGVGVLIFGSSWEIYDLSVGTRFFDDKHVATLKLDPAIGYEPEYIANVLSRWIHKDRWWSKDAADPSR